MYGIYMYLKTNGWHVQCLCSDWLLAEAYEGREPDGNIENIFAEKDGIALSITSPHSGNGFKFLLRADYAASHDRWSNSDYEDEFDSALEVLNNLIFANYKQYLV